jgi:AraC family transcriptional regulator
MPAATPGYDASPEEGRCLPHGVHSGVQLANFATTGYIVSEHAYAVGLRMVEHAHDTPFIYAVLPVRRSSAPFIHAPEVGFAPAGVEHPRQIIDDDYRMLHIDIMPDYAAELIGESNAAKEHVCTDPYTFRAAMQLRDELGDHDTLSTFEVNSLIAEMSASLLRFGRQLDSVSTPRWLDRVVRELAERYKEDLSLEYLAAEANVHPVHVSRVFRRCHGETLRDYIRRLRIQEACRILKSGMRSIAEVASETGYYDESHFSKAFKRVMGTTPGQYRGEFQRA